MDPKFDMHHILLIDKLSRTENFVKLKDNKRKESEKDRHTCNLGPVHFAEKKPKHCSS